jgi:serine/threonine protein kinase
MFRIREGKFEFPPEEWDNISDEAKDLISHLLVKNVRQRYTANDVLSHSWITSAPETPLQTPNNLFRKNSTKDIQQYNDHFNINHFANRLSSRVEETIQSVGSTPENESALQAAMANSNSDDVIMQASKLLEQESVNYPPPLINMNGVIIYAPPMAQSQLPYLYPISKLETSAEQIGRVKSNLDNNQLDNVDVAKLQKHRGSLATAISQLGLETCQNMVRQVCFIKKLPLNSILGLIKQRHPSIK